MLKDYVQRAIRKSGHMLVRWPPEGSIGRELQRLIEDRNIKTVLDVGANVGQYGRELRDIGYQGRIISFEPSPDDFSELTAHADAQWETHQIALGDKEGVATLHVHAVYSQFSSLHRASEFGRGEDWKVDDTREVQVPVRRLDDVVAELDVDLERTLVKIDTQGHDAAVIRGGENTISRVAGLQVELPSLKLYENMPDLADLIAQIQALGFSMLGTFPVHQHPRPLVPIEFDGVFARTH